MVENESSGRPDHNNGYIGIGLSQPFIDPNVDYLNGPSDEEIEKLREADRIRDAEADARAEQWGKDRDEYLRKYVSGEIPP